MTASTVFKSLLKMAVIILFLTERSWYYEQMKTQPSDVFHIHHEILPAFDVDYKRVDTLYESHQIFNLPFTKWTAEKMKEFVEHHTNLNQTLEHQKHSHMQNLLRTFKNKLVDLDIKYEFFFITAYDLLIFSLLVFFVLSNSLIVELILINDTLLKIFTLLKESAVKTNMPLVYDKFLKVIKDFLNRDFPDAWKIITTFFHREKLLLINSAILGILIALFIYLLTEKYSQGLSLEQVSDIAHELKDKIGEKMHDLGVGISKEVHKFTSPDLTKTREKPFSPENMGNLKTMESEEGMNSNYKNEDISQNPYEQKEVNTNKKKRPTTPSKRRPEKATL
jgi:hypothetical protein